MYVPGVKKHYWLPHKYVDLMAYDSSLNFLTEMEVERWSKSPLHAKTQAMVTPVRRYGTWEPSLIEVGNSKLTSELENTYQTMIHVAPGARSQEWDGREVSQTGKTKRGKRGGRKARDRQAVMDQWQESEQVGLEKAFLSDPEVLPEGAPRGPG